MTKAKSKEIASTDLYSNEMPAHLQGKEGSQRGSEDVGIDDLTIPRISIIQDLSPQHKESKSEYIEGAKVGMAFNTATLKLLGSGFLIIPVLFRKEFVLWKDRKAGGGFGGAFDTPEQAKAEMVNLEDANKYDIVDTGQHFCLIVNEATGASEEAVVSMSKSQMKVSRQLNTMARIAGGDRFSRVYKLEVVADQNKNGDDYYNWKVTQLGYAPEDLYRKAEKMYEDVKAGQRDVSRSEDSEGSPTDNTEAPSGLSDEDFDNM